LDCKYSQTNAYQVLPQFFQKLEDIEISYLYEEPIPTTVFTQMLSSKVLKNLKLYAGLLPQQILSTFISKAREENSGVFSNLENLYLSSFFNLSVQTWLELFCVAPSLKEALFCNNDNDVEQYYTVKNFIHRNNLNIVCDLVYYRAMCRYS
jgi:hypothetical protein